MNWFWTTCSESTLTVTSNQLPLMHRRCHASTRRSALLSGRRRRHGVSVQPSWNPHGSDLSLLPAFLMAASIHLSDI
jgi:hypothetical protein